MIILIIQEHSESANPPRLIQFRTVMVSDPVVSQLVP